MRELVIVTNNPTASGTLRLESATHSLGVNAVVTPISAVTTAQTINEARAVIFRISPLSYVVCEALLPQLHEPHARYLKRCLDAFDKEISTTILTAAQLPMPGSKVVTAGRLKYENNFPFVVKVTRGNRGAGVHLISSLADRDEVIEVYPTDQSLVYQEYIAQARGKDKRLFVVGGSVVAAMQRRSTTDDFRANLHLGGKASTYSPTIDEEKIAITATKALGLVFGGVDIIDSDRGSLILEVNPSPGLAIENITGITVAEKIIKETLRGYDG